MKLNKLKSLILLAVFALILIPTGLFLGKLWADGNFIYGLVAANGANYLFPTQGSAGTGAGAVLVYDGTGIFRWSNDGSTAALNAPRVPNLTLAQMNAAAPGGIGQLIYVTNATSTSMCVSSGTAAGSWIQISTNTVISGGAHCN